MGFVLRSRRLVPEEFWLPCERLNYFCLFPALMFSQIARASLGDLPLRAIAATVLGAAAVGAALVFAARFMKPQAGPTFSSVLQGALRPNTYVGVAAATAVFGRPGLMATSIAIAVALPLFNIGSILILALYGEQKRTDSRSFARAVAGNPVVASVFAGALANVSGLPLPTVAMDTLTILSSASLPLGLLSVGAGLEPGAVRIAYGQVLQSSAVKLIALPFFAYQIGTSVGLDASTLGGMVLFSALPCTPSTYIMARLLGGDHRVAAGIISAQTLLAALTMPLALALAGG
nr:AEC family transporter [Methylosinus sp. Sm6]